MSPKAKKPAGQAAVAFRRKFEKKNKMLLKKAPILRICRSELSSVFGKTNTKNVARSFTHAVMSRAQKKALDVAELAYRSAKMLNSVDEDGEPLMVTENNLRLVLAVMGEKPWPKRQLNSSKQKDTNMTNVDKIKEKIEQSLSSKVEVTVVN